MQCLGAVWENELLMTEKGNKRYSGAQPVVKDRVIIDADGGELSGVADDHCGRANTGKVVWQFDTRLAVRHPIIRIL